MNLFLHIEELKCHPESEVCEVAEGANETFSNFTDFGDTDHERIFIVASCNLT